MTPSSNCVPHIENRQEFPWRTFDSKTMQCAVHCLFWILKCPRASFTEVFYYSVQVSFSEFFILTCHQFSIVTFSNCSWWVRWVIDDTTDIAVLWCKWHLTWKICGWHMLHGMSTEEALTENGQVWISRVKLQKALGMYWQTFYIPNIRFLARGFVSCCW